MKKNELFKKIKIALAEVLNITTEEIKMESSLMEDLGADSIDMATLLVTMEDEFEQELDLEELKKVVTVKDIVRYIQLSHMITR